MEAGRPIRSRAMGPEGFAGAATRAAHGGKHQAPHFRAIDLSPGRFFTGWPRAAREGVARSGAGHPCDDETWQSLADDSAARSQPKRNFNMSSGMGTSGRLRGSGSGGSTW
ncbi:hypothetical protein GCM10017624_26830 [Azotobacter vinelandii]|nr:hypothetical protein GCM10017624_26830 [Azotobacter vinelandii]